MTSRAYKVIDRQNTVPGRAGPNVLIIGWNYGTSVSVLWLVFHRPRIPWFTKPSNGSR